MKRANFPRAKRFRQQGALERLQKQTTQSKESVERGVSEKQWAANRELQIKKLEAALKARV